MDSLKLGAEGKNICIDKLGTYFVGASYDLWKGIALLPLAFDHSFNDAGMV